MRFDGFVGNAPVKRQLEAAVDGGRLPHALLLEGPPGCGKRTLARLIARAAICVGEQKPCGVCPQCIKALAGSHPDITELTGEGASGNIRVQAIRDLRTDAWVMPNEAARKVFIIPEAQHMLPAAQNALLKVLEEPPASALFILTCGYRSQLLPTVQSRCETLTLRGVTEAEAWPLLKQACPTQTDTQLRTAFAAFDGVIGSVLAAAGDDRFAEIRQTAASMAQAVTAQSELPLLELTAPLIKDKVLTDGVLGNLILLFRDALVVRNTQGTPAMPQLSGDPTVVQTLATGLTASQLMALIGAVQELQTARRSNINANLLATLLCARMRRAAGR